MWFVLRGSARIALVREISLRVRAVLGRYALGVAPYTAAAGNIS
jgi:hypothetical protein